MSTSMPATVDAFGVTTHVTGEAIPSSDFNRLQDGLRATEALVVGPLFVNVKGYGAAGDGATDDTTAIQNAINAVNTAGGGAVYFPAGTYVHAGLTMYSLVHLHGAGINATVLRLKNAGNTDSILGQNFATLTGGNTTGGIHSWSINDLTIDGNTANQSAGSGYCLRVYGYGYELHNLRIRNGSTGGFYSEWSTSATVPTPDGASAVISGLRVHDCTDRGINFLGPKNSQLDQIVAYNCHRPIHIDPAGGADGCQITSVRAWGVTTSGDWCAVFGNNWGSLANVVAYGGITGQVLVNASHVTGSAIQLYAGVATPNSVYGLQIGDGTYSATGNMLHATVYECQAGAVNFGGDGGNSYYEVIANISAGVYVAGAPAATTKFRLMECGQYAGNFWETSGVGQSWTLGDTAFTTRFNFNLLSGYLEALNGSHIRGYSDNWTTQKFDLDASTGAILGGSFSDANTASATVLATGNTITPVAGTGSYRMAPTAAVTGIILATGLHDCMEITIFNESAFAITFAAVGTSHVANGVSSVIAANTARSFKYNAAKTLWYPLV